MAWAMSVESLPDLDADRELARSLRAQRPDLTTLTDSALHARARAMVPYIQQTFENAMRVSTLSSLGPGALGAICEGLGDATHGDPAAGRHRGRLGGAVARDVGARPGGARVGRRSARRSTPGPTTSLARLEASGERRGTRLPRPDSASSCATTARAARTSTTRVRRRGRSGRASRSAAIDLMRKSDESQAPAIRQAASVAERDRVAAEIREKIAGDAETAGLFEAALRSAQLFLAGRERAKTNCVMVINEVRMALYEYGRRLVERGLIDEVEQVFMVTDEELDQLRADPESFRDVIAERWAQYKRLFDYEPVFVVNGRVPGLDEMTHRAHEAASPRRRAGTVLKGAAGSGGVATGRARVVLDAADPDGLEPGDVLVAPQTDPSWVPLFVPAAAVVVNVGAMGSHAMIVSRELGIPCVVSVADAHRHHPRRGDRHGRRQRRHGDDRQPARADSVTGADSQVRIGAWSSSTSSCSAPAPPG